MSTLCDPTLQEQVGAALYRAGHEQASYQPPRLRARPAFLGSCTPGWIAELIPGEWCMVAYRPAGILTAADSYAVQAAKLEQYSREVFSTADWEHMWSRREGIAALLVRKVAPDGG